VRSRLSTFHEVGYAVAFAGIAVALVVGLALPAATTRDRWVHVVVVAGIVVGVGMLAGLLLIVIGGLRRSYREPD
jgi:hypothetical protein